MKQSQIFLIIIAVICVAVLAYSVVGTKVRAPLTAEDAVVDIVSDNSNGAVTNTEDSVMPAPGEGGMADAGVATPLPTVEAPADDEAGTTDVQDTTTAMPAGDPSNDDAQAIDTRVVNNSLPAEAGAPPEGMAAEGSPADTAPADAADASAAMIAMDASSSALANSAWTLSTLNGVNVPADAKATLSFMADGKVQGNGGCNNFGGNYTAQGDTLAFGPLMSTKMACAVMETESTYMQALSQVAGWRIDGATLTLTDTAGATLATFMAQ